MLNCFNNEIVYISQKSFNQNKIISKELRRYVKDNLEETFTLVCIGGESYLFGLTTTSIKNVVNYTNSVYIYNDANFNNYFYRKIKINKIIDYNKISEISEINEISKILIINLARLNTNLMKIINKNIYKKIIIINCHHNDFWKKIKLLSNYKLISREKFLTDINFITVNIFIFNREFISLGENCAVAWNLKELNFKRNSYPFDWCKMSLNKLNNVLENNFKDYSNVIIKKFSENHLTFDEKACFNLTNKYNITFSHEVTNKYTSVLDERIKKFKSSKNPIFVMLLLSNKNHYNNLIILIKNLQMYFKNFNLAIISKNLYNFNNNTCDIGIEIKNISFKEFHQDWKYPNINWSNIFLNAL
jgi:hypothetical protein